MEEEIVDVAKQVHIKLEKEEIAKYTIELEEKVRELEVINEVDTEVIEKDVAVINQFNALREDVVKVFEKELLMQNAPEEENGMFKMPKILN